MTLKHRGNINIYPIIFSIDQQSQCVLAEYSGFSLSEAVVIWMLNQEGSAS